MQSDVLTKEQVKLRKRADQPGGLAAMTERELQVWAAACRKLMDYADRGPARNPKARRQWLGMLREVEAVLASRSSDDEETAT